MDLIGSQIGDYHVVELIGTGGMGSVFRARHRTLPRDVALKVRTGRAEREDAEIQRFCREARFMAQLSHPNLVKIFDTGVHDGLLWLAMELVPGKTMTEYLEAHPRMPVPRACQWIRECCRALAALHERGIVHRDLKPDNIMITESGVVKVMDFGLARDASSTMLTAPGEMVGTPAYLAPETLAAGPCDTRVDVYQMGVVLYLCVTGELPYTAATLNEYLGKALYEPPTPPSQYLPGIPDALTRILQKALQKDPQLRLPTATAMADALDAVLEEIEHGTPANVRPLITRQRPRLSAPPPPWNRRALAAAALVGIGLAACAATMIFRKGEVGPPLATATPDAAARERDAPRAALLAAARAPGSGEGVLAALRALAGRAAPGDAAVAADALATLIGAEEVAVAESALGLAHHPAGRTLAAAAAPLAKEPAPAGPRVELFRLRLAAESGRADTAAAARALSELRNAHESGALDAGAWFEALLAAAAVHRYADDPDEAAPLADAALELFERGAVTTRARRLRAAAAVIETSLEAYRKGDTARRARASAVLADHREVLAPAWLPHYTARFPKLAEQLDMAPGASHR